MSTQLDIFNHFKVTARQDDDILRTRTFEVTKTMVDGAIVDNKWLSFAGRIGSGKTQAIISALREVHDERGNLHVVELKSPDRKQINAQQVLAAFIRTLGKEYLGDDHLKRGLDARQIQVDRILMSAKMAGNTVVLLIDEAQELHPSVLNTIKRLRDVTFIKRAVHLPVVLIGQPMLAGMVENNIEVQNRISSYQFGYNRMELIEIAKWHGCGLLSSEICVHLVDTLTNERTIESERLPTPLLLKKKIGQALERAYRVGAMVVTLDHFDLPALPQARKRTEPKKKVEITSAQAAATVNQIGKNKEVG